MFAIEIGVTVKDRLTGFSGVVTGRADYITGCNQYLVRPTKLKETGEMHDGNWLDEQRLEVVNAAVHPAAKAVQVETARASRAGADTQAPTK